MRAKTPDEMLAEFDLFHFGTSVMVDGKRIDPARVLVRHSRPSDAEVGVNALEQIKLQSEECLGVRMETITSIAVAALAVLKREPQP